MEQNKNKYKQNGNRHTEQRMVPSGSGAGGLGEKGEGLRRTDGQSQNSHGV